MLKKDGGNHYLRRDYGVAADRVCMQSFRADLLRLLTCPLGAHEADQCLQLHAQRQREGILFSDIYNTENPLLV